MRQPLFFLISIAELVCILGCQLDGEIHHLLHFGRDVCIDFVLESVPAVGVTVPFRIFCDDFRTRIIDSQDTYYRAVAVIDRSESGPALFSVAVVPC